MSFKNLWLNSILGCAVLCGQAFAAEVFPAAHTLADEATVAAFDPLTTSIPWQPNTLDAMVMAVEKNRPLVVVFMNPHEPGDDALDTLFVDKLERDGLADFHNKAVFVKVELIWEKCDRQDDFGMRIARQQQIEKLPAVSYISPNVDILTEVYRTQGDFPIEEIREDMAKGLTMAMDSSKTWQAASPAELVRQFHEAHQLGQREKYAACFAEPIHMAMLAMVRAQTEAGNAKRRMLNAIDDAFGPQSDRLSFVDDDEEMIGELRQITGADLIEAKSENGRVILQVLFTKLERTGALKKELQTFDTVKERFGWRLLPANADKSAERMTRLTAQLESIPQDFDRIAQEVAVGKYGSAADARDAAAAAYYSRKAAQVAGSH